MFFSLIDVLEQAIRDKASNIPIHTNKSVGGKNFWGFYLGLVNSHGLGHSYQRPWNVVQVWDKARSYQHATEDAYQRHQHQSALLVVGLPGPEPFIVGPSIQRYA
jgi:hypothetical protein